MSGEQTREERQRLSEEKKRAQLKLKGKLDSEDNNPCLKEHHLVNNCLMDNRSSEKDCEIYIENYKVCKSFWWTVSLDRRRKGIIPELPPADERVKIKADFMKKFHNN